jgi:hypothetical protein
MIRIVRVVETLVSRMADLVAIGKGGPGLVVVGVVLALSCCRKRLGRCIDVVLFGKTGAVAVVVL